MNRFDDYRREQALWLGEQMKSKRFRKTRNRIVLMHIPPIIPGEDNSPEGHAVKHLNALFVPLFNKAGVDLVLSGHTHRHFFVDKGTAENKFPLVINDHKSVIDLSVEGEKINVKITDEKGQITFDQNF
ncbi:MAG: metallophosphoesterase [Bacteroidaceae bacterium]|nr:metallophosphoesterase [Bacteroidaceae bacterium]